MTTNINSKICNVCGSANVIEKEYQKYLSVPYGQPAMLNEKIVHCNDCESDIDITSEKEIENTIDLVRKESVKSILDFLSEAGYSLAQIERALELPQRTISRWKSSSELSSVGIALLRIIRTYPWIIDVAENKFDNNFANILLIQKALNIFSNLMQHSGNLMLQSGGYVSSSPNTYSIPSEVTFFLNYGNPSTPPEGINFFASQQSILFEEVSNENS